MIGSSISTFDITIQSHEYYLYAFDWIKNDETAEFTCRSSGFVGAVAQLIQHLAFHVIRRRDAEMGEDRRGKVQDAGTLKTAPARTSGPNGQSECVRSVVTRVIGRDAHILVARCARARTFLSAARWLSWHLRSS